MGGGKLAKKPSLAESFPEVAKQWHPEKNGNLSPRECMPKSNRIVWWCCEAGHEWIAKINNRTSGGTGCPYCEGTIPIVGVNDFRSLYPCVAAEWHPEKNGDLHPEHVLPQSNHKVWWRCKAGHEWMAKIYHRSIGGHGCPYCAGQKPIVGISDLATVLPEIAKQWHPDKNGKMMPCDVSPYSHKKVYWICERGHEWSAMVFTRSEGRNCPVCCGRKVISGENDIGTLMPNLVSEWNSEKNDGKTPAMFALHSNKSVWWRCERGHEWRAKINNRANGSGCPYCSHNSIISEETSLAATNESLTSEWDVSKNYPTMPGDVAMYSNHKFWWKCGKGHSWQATVANRQFGEGCPYCANRLPILGETDLLTVNPKLAAEWHPSKNGDILPSQVLPMSNMKIWWVCHNSHEWEAPVFARNLGSGCPYCAHRIAMPGETDLATVNPKLVAEWHPTKNGDLLPHNFLPYSSTKIWWQCKNGHEWKTSIASRSCGSKCPQCRKIPHKYRKP